MKSYTKVLFTLKGYVNELKKNTKAVEPPPSGTQISRKCL